MSKVRKQYRFRGDIAAELEGLVRLANVERGDQEIEYTETFIVEAAIVAYVTKIKRHLEAKTTQKGEQEDLE